MIKKAKVSRSAVAAFKESVAETKKLSARIENCENCISEMQKVIEEQINGLNDSVSLLEKSQDKAEKKIHEIDKQLSCLSAEREIIQAQLDAVEAEMAVTSESYTYTDENGQSYEVSNPTYLALCGKEASLSEEISTLDGQIDEVIHQLDHASSVSKHITSHINTINSMVYSLKEKVSECSKLSTEIADICSANNRQCVNAYELLCKIEQLIQEYLSVKIKLEQSIAYDMKHEISAEQLVGISININVKQVINNRSDTSEVTDEPSETDDNGKQYRIGDDLIRNNRFQINGYEYETDNYGRTIVASGKLSINELGQENRNMTDSKEVIGKGDEQEQDDRGHLIGHQFNGSDRMENLVPQDWRINRKSFRKLEDSLAGQVKTGHDVSVSVIPFYGNDTRRPAGIFYFYNIDGVSNIVLFPNDVTEEEND